MMRTMGRVSAMVAAALALGSAAQALPKPGKAAPAWSGKTVAGKPISSAQYKGKALLVNFFSYG